MTQPDSPQKTALVTGAGGGIGRAISEALARVGARVIAVDIDEAAGTETAVRTGGRFMKVNLMRPTDIEKLVDTVAGEYGSVDMLVNNAGIQHVAAVDDMPVDKWDAIIAINLSAVFHMTRCVLPLMKKGGWGRIVNIASAHALVASPYKSAYVAAKHGVAGLTKTVALEVAEQGITCNAICPGYVMTDLVKNQIKDTARARGITEHEVMTHVLLAAQPTKKFVTVDEVAQFTSFLCSDAAASITGSLLPIDGGWTAQ